MSAVQLGFVVFEVSDPAAWHALLTEVIGLVAVGEGRYRMDGHAWRLQVVPGPADDLAAVGWELDDAGLAAAVKRLRDAGVDVTEADADARGARARFCLTDPAGIPVELVAGLTCAGAPFESPVVPGGFVADDLGLGHVVLSTPDQAASVAFYERLLGARLSDRIATTYHGHAVDLSFFHVNPRHHSVAFGGPQRKRLHHLLFEVRTLEEVGRGFDRCVRHGVRLFQTIGRHPNDHMTSFYAFTPSGFQFEYGFGGRLVDDATWTPVTYDAISTWGHVPLAVLAPARRA